MRKLFILALAVIIGLTAQQTYAQGNATLTGAVTDPNGAVVAGATVKATNKGTSLSYDTQSTDAGLYRFPTLPVGVYTVAVEATGFKSTQIENVTLTVGQTTTQDLKLEIGAPTETVTVQSGGEQLAQPNESSVSALLNRKVWENFPLENRDTSVQALNVFVKSFVTSPLFNDPRVTDVRHLQNLRRDILSVIDLSNTVKKVAGKLNN